MKKLVCALACFVFASCAGRTSVEFAGPKFLSSVQEGQKLYDFQAKAIYLGNESKPMGVKFQHVPTGMNVYLLQIETVPQAAMWFNTPSVSDAGEAHALEHVLLGKGKKGKLANAVTQMSLGSDSATTHEYFTYYHFYTNGGVDGFFSQFEHTLDALLNLQTTDEQIRREVFHFGYQEDPGTKELELVEKGTVYNEMVGSEDRWMHWYTQLQIAYGENHPFTRSQGGHPKDIRGLTAERIRAFHEKHYNVSKDLGIISVFHPRENVGAILKRMSQTFQKFRSKWKPLNHPSVMDQIPEVKPSLYQKNHTQRVTFPSKSKDVPAKVSLFWKPLGKLSAEEKIQLGQFLAAFNQKVVRKFLLDSETRKIQTGAKSASCSLYADVPANLFHCAVSGIDAKNINRALLEKLRTFFVEGIHEVAFYADQSDDLIEFNQKVLVGIQAARRARPISLGSPPAFGVRGTYDSWKQYLEFVEHTSGFQKDLLLEKQSRQLEEGVSSNKNIWKELLGGKGLLDKPYIIYGMPDPEHAKRLSQLKESRLSQELERLKKVSKTTDAQVALREFRKNYDQKTMAIESASGSIQRPRLTDTPPMTYDDEIRFDKRTYLGVPAIVSYFDVDPRIQIGLVFDLKGISKDSLMFLPLLPTILRSMGVVQDGGDTLDYQAFNDLVEKDVWGLGASLSSSVSTNRYEFIVNGIGVGSEEFVKALKYVQMILFQNHLSVKNIARLRDLIDRRVSSGRSFTSGPSDGWIEDLSFGFRHQKNQIYRNQSVHYAVHHNLNRIQWMLKDPTSEEELAKVRSEFLALIPRKGNLDREKIKQVLNPSQFESTRKELAEYLVNRIDEVNDENLHDDLIYLVNQALDDLKVDPKEVVKKLKGLQDEVIRRNALSIYVTGNRAAIRESKNAIEELLKKIPHRAPVGFEIEGTPYIVENLQSRYPQVKYDFPAHVGFVHAAGTNGSIDVRAEGPGFEDLSESAMIEFLAAKLFSGGGPHSLFMNTWEAGLAYSNGMANALETGAIVYSAGRSPNIRATTRFARNLVSDFSVFDDASYFSDYVLSRAFSFSRAHRSFSSRGTAIAADLRDGATPQKVRKFSRGLLKLKKDPDLLSKMKEIGRKPVKKVFPGLGAFDLQREAKSTFLLCCS